LKEADAEAGDRIDVGQLPVRRVLGGQRGHGAGLRAQGLPSQPTNRRPGREGQHFKETQERAHDQDRICPLVGINRSFYVLIRTHQTGDMDIEHQRPVH
jgi:hypothetical protein